MKSSSSRKSVAILLVDHGSRRREAHEQLVEIASRLASSLEGEGAAIVEIAHMDVAQPDIRAGFMACVRRGASHVTVVPCLLSRGRHVTEHIPQLVSEAASLHTEVAYHIVAPLVECDGFIQLLRTTAEASH